MKHWPNILLLACLFLLSAGTADPPRLLLEPPQELRSFVEGSSAFALELHAKLAGDHGNLILSPYSLSAALAVARAGARGQTEAQIAGAAHFPTNQTELRVALARVRGELAQISKSGHVQLSAATALWAQKNYGFRQSYLDLIRTNYESSVEFVDFISSGAGVARQIDSWISRQTRGKLTGGMPAGMLTPVTRLIIVNAIYFKGDWASRFAKSATRRQPFWTTATASVTVPMMRQEHDFLYGETNETQVVELPYVGRELSMIVLLPKQREGLAAMERNLDASRLRAWTTTLGLYRVELALPRFKVISKVSLVEPLKALGITDSFDITRADFTGMTARRPFFIQAVEQSSVVEVNEEGTEAASATQISFGCGRTAAPPRREFRADHPFLFYIRENRTGTILFLGRVVDPSR